MMTESMMKIGIDATASTLIHSLWQGTVIVSVLAMVWKWVPRSSAVVRYRCGAAASFGARCLDGVNLRRRGG